MEQDSEVMESVPIVPLERLKERIHEQIVDFFVFLIKDSIVGVVQTIPRECWLPRTEQIVETLVPHLREENCVDVMPLIPQERVNRTKEPIVGVPVRQITEDGLEQIAAVLVPRIKEVIVEVPPCRVPQDMEEI